MGWPTPQDYNEAVQHPSSSLTDPELQAGTPRLTPLGLPRAITGGFASVYQLHSGQRAWAVRCFLREVPDQHERYAAISQHLAAHPLPAMVDFAYQDAGIRAGGQTYPLLKMAWLHGTTLEQWVAQHLNQPAALQQLAEDWLALVRALGAAGVAHGDLQHGNILVVNGQLRLIDYDGLYVPALAGYTANEVGHRNYQHPARTVADFGPDLDRFAAWSIYLSLRGLSLQPGLWQQLRAGDEALLLRREDYQQPASSAALQALAAVPDRPFGQLVEQFQQHLTAPTCTLPPLPGTTPAARPQQLLRRQRASGAPTPRPAPVVSGAAAWLGDHLPLVAPPTPPRSYLVERYVAGTTLTLVLLLVASLLPGWLSATAGLLGVVLVGLFCLLFLLGRYLASPLLLPLLAARWRVWRCLSWASLATVHYRLATYRLDRLRDQQRPALATLHQQRSVLTQAFEQAATLTTTAQSDQRQQEAQLVAAEASALAQALAQWQQQTLTTALSTHTLLAAKITGISPLLQLRLLAAGIRTAAQIAQIRHDPADPALAQIVRPDQTAVTIAGLDWPLAQQLLAWQQEIARQETARLPAQLPATTAAAIRLRYHTRREQLARRTASILQAAARQQAQQEADLQQRLAALHQREEQLTATFTTAQATHEAAVAAAQRQQARRQLALLLARRNLAAYRDYRFRHYLRQIIAW